MVEKNEYRAPKRFLLGSIPKLFTMGYYYGKQSYAKSMLNLPFMFYLDGKMDVGRLEESIKRIISEEPVLRSYLVEEKGEFYVVEKEKQEFTLPLHKAEGKDKAEKIQYAKAYCDKKVREPLPIFDSEKQVFLLELMEIETDYHVLIFIIHHSFADLSASILLCGDILGYYADDQYQRRKALSYEEVMEKELSLQGSEEEKTELAYWDSQISSFENAGMPTDEELGEGEKLTEETTEIQFDTQELESLAKANQTSLFNVLTMIIQMGIAKANDCNDTLVKYAIANRTEPSFQNSFGCLTRALYTRYDFDDRENVASTYKNFRKKIGEAHLNRHVAWQLPGRACPYLITNQDISGLGPLPTFDGKEITFELRENAKISDSLTIFTIPMGSKWIIRIGTELNKYSIYAKKVMDAILLAERFLHEYPDGKIGDYLRNDITLDTLEKLKETDSIQIIEI